MQQHVQVGFDLVKGISFLSDAAEIILTHHERFDGSGYPRGLQGEAISLGARIFSIADALDAITSDRPYRRASSFAYARERIRGLSAQHFDPRIVDIFLNIPEGTWPAIAKNQRQVPAFPTASPAKVIFSVWASPCDGRLKAGRPHCLQQQSLRGFNGKSKPDCFGDGNQRGQTRIAVNRQRAV